MALLNRSLVRSSGESAPQADALSASTHIGHPKFAELRDSVSQVIRGKDDVITTVLTALLAGGSVLLEDLPGVGKTTLAKTVARLIDLRFNRLQCTSDLLPADVYGFSVFNSKEGTFSFRRGPVFCNLLLVDEINRASPRTQSALLEAMAENQVTVEGSCHPLEHPFLVIATQNPSGFQGTYPLPEAQLDRFLFHLSMDYPDQASEVDLLYDQNDANLESLQPVMTAEELEALQKQALEVEVHRDLADYIVRIVAGTREHDQIEMGVSPRGAKMLFRAAQAAAMIAGRTHVLPDDIQSLASRTLAHRISIRGYAESNPILKRDLINEIVRSTAVPV